MSYTIRDLEAIVREWRTKQAEGETAWSVTVHGSDVAFSTLPDGSTLALLYAAGRIKNYATIRDRDLAQERDLAEGDLDGAYAHEIGRWLSIHPGA